MRNLIVAACLLVAASASAAENTSVVPGPILGEAAVENGNTKLAREQALQDAMRKALQQGAGAVIDTASVVEGGTLVQDRIFVHANGYLKSYDVGTDAVQDGVYQITLSNVRVGLSELSKDMAAVHAMLATHAHPRVALMVRETSFEGMGNATAKDKAGTFGFLGQGISQQRMGAQLASVGWHLIDSEVAAGKVHLENGMTTDTANLNARELAPSGADYVVVGTVTVRPREGTSGIHAVEARAVVRIESTDNGAIVGSVEETKMGSSAMDDMAAASKALEQIGDDVVAELSKQVLESWRKRDNGVGQIHLYAVVSDYDVLQALENQIQKGVANVKAVDEVSFNDGKADLAVSMAGTNSKQFAGALSGKSVNGMQVKVTKVTANSVEVKLVR